MEKEMIKVKKWIIFRKFGMNQRPYILDSTHLDVNDNELAINIYEQIFKLGEKNNGKTI